MTDHRFSARTIGQVALLCICLLLMSCEKPPAASIRVGILHSLTGTMKISEEAVVDATRMAIDEINATGGLLGRQLEPVLADGASDAGRFRTEAERLIVEEGVDVIFGGWTSASRKEMKTVVEDYRHLLFYPVQYEGMESSAHIVYLGAAPNQQLLPAVKWFFDNRGTKFFFIGSDYIYPRCANAAARDYIEYLGGEIVGEHYIPLGSTDVAVAVKAIEDSDAEVIINTINGSSNLAFFTALRSAGIRSSDIPTLSLSLGEAELASMEKAELVGDFAAWNYFQSEENEANHRFVEMFKKIYGAERTLSDPMAAAYSGVHLWAQAVRDAGGSAPAQVLEQIGNQYFEGPQGNVYVDAYNLHTWKAAKIGKIRADGQFDLVWQSEAIIHPVPYPPSRTRSEWNRLLQHYWRLWGGHWININAEPLSAEE